MVERRAGTALRQQPRDMFLVSAILCYVEATELDVERAAVERTLNSVERLESLCLHAALSQGKLGGKKAS